MPKVKRRRNNPPKPVFKIFCEGAKTEPFYIKNYIGHFHSQSRNIILVEDTSKNTPVQLVDVATDARTTGHKDDVIWVVFDRESEAKYSNVLHSRARNKANANNIEIALSSVCFEYWILLHFLYTTASYNSCEDLLKKSNLLSFLGSVGVTNYDKGDPLLFEKIKSRIDCALENSAKLKSYVVSCSENSSSNVEPHRLNPYTDIHEMFLDMKNFIEGKPSIRA